MIIAPTPWRVAFSHYEYFRWDILDRNGGHVASIACREQHPFNDGDGDPRDIDPESYANAIIIVNNANKQEGKDNA